MCIARITAPLAATLLITPSLLVAAAQASPSSEPLEETKSPAAQPAPVAESPTRADEAAAAPSEATNSPISLQFNLDYTTAYYYHGIRQEDTGFILQPAAKLTMKLWEHDEFRVDAILATWNSFQASATGAQTNNDFAKYWYESDLTAGAAFTWGKLSVTTTYTFLTSPSDAYDTVQELDVTLAFDDSNLLGKLALHPYVLLGRETGSDASDGTDSNPGIYLELGIAPGFSFNLGTTPISIALPASVGLSLNDYYQDAAGEDDAFGFAQVGLKASMPLPFGDKVGAWTLNAGIAGIFLGDHTRMFNGGERSQVIGTLGLQVNF